MVKTVELQDGSTFDIGAGNLCATCHMSLPEGPRSAAERYATA
jgi:hypothetical protein